MNEDPQLTYYRQILDERIKESIDTYSNEIRNLSIISGVLAPLSLSLLTTEKLDLNQNLLLLGFTFLVFNILLNQLFLNRYINKHDQKVLKAEFNWILADGINLDGEKDIIKQVTQKFDQLKKTNEIDKLLGLGKFNVSIQDKRSQLRRYNKFSNYIFYAGIIYIILSIWTNKILILIFTHL